MWHMMRHGRAHHICPAWTWAGRQAGSPSCARGWLCQPRHSFGSKPGPKRCCRDDRTSLRRVSRWPVRVRQGWPATACACVALGEISLQLGSSLRVLGGELAWLPLPRIVSLYHAVASKVVRCALCPRIPARTPRCYRLARLPKPPTRHDVLAASSRDMVGRQGHGQSR